ncbi:MAG TPA: hypothetical protein VGI03_00150 [Verrucomicrobiae bacterium]|jgi:hypothetical protein
MKALHLPSSQLRLPRWRLILAVSLGAIWIGACAIISDHLPRVLILQDDGVLEGLYGFSYEGLFDFFLLIILGALVWSAFRLVEPIRYRRKWAIARPVIILTIWLMIVIALDFFLGYLEKQTPNSMVEHLWPPPLRF